MKILIFGGGSMGQAFARGINSSSSEHSSSVIEINPANIVLCESSGASVYTSLEELAKNDDIKSFDVCIVCVKPKDVENAANKIIEFLPTSCLIISIAAGVKIERLESYFKGFPVVRAMPNIAASELLSATAMCESNVLKESDLYNAKTILQLLGVVVRVDESQMDLVTAISGSGPAYFFKLAEQLIASAEQRGMSIETAHQLVRQTFLGSATMGMNDGSFSVLREKVTSPGGTTQAALEVFEEKEFESIVDQAVSAAVERSIELSKSDSGD